MLWQKQHENSISPTSENFISRGTFVISIRQLPAPIMGDMVLNRKQTEWTVNGSKYPTALNSEFVRQTLPPPKKENECAPSGFTTAKLLGHNKG
ncbi:uncharacterized protein N7487_006023 [Penicillium crustosum]|uniref:uncharacterized protein n=1 Tax=Penicillium crustosum TaxID=36656 RepID=UPI002382E0D2|nr:uncharacterized protein N7487_006023 [Penicillium crustosum]KAJ5411664.1 hypothetical protein N7487_006023 [Penicillium crustosum]